MVSGGGRLGGRDAGTVSVRLTRIADGVGVAELFRMRMPA
jgi:hypothetical protein